jgi:plastocyanin
MLAVLVSTVFVLGGVLAGSPVGSTVVGAQAQPEPSSAPERVVDVRIVDNHYRPKRIRVPVGTAVRWRNAGRNEHNVLPDKGDRFGVDDIPRGETYSYRFDKPGRYGYYCSFHGAPRTGQFGTVTVKQAKAQGDGDAPSSKD